MKIMSSLKLRCNTCQLTIEIVPDDQESLFYVEHYGQIDPVTKRIFELNCPLCSGRLQKVERE